MIFEESAGSELKNDLNLWKVEPLGTAECRLHAVTWSPRVNLKDIMRRSGPLCLLPVDITLSLITNHLITAQHLASAGVAIASLLQFSLHI
ncbi:hypothetical protein V6N12_007023 [Hibiscus sabdariffa]|uniref:Uncharacterized protein n=1 Tax=Hibiscus sabdariffa TaxID=183260 RepID=A0ABR2F0K8_9ROSI